MRIGLKHLIINIIALLLLASCQNNATIDVNTTKGNADSSIMKNEYNFRNVVYRELMHGAYCAETDNNSVEFNYNDYDLRACGEVVERIMTEKGLIIDKEVMKKQTDSLFNIKLEGNTCFDLYFNRIRFYIIDSLYRPEISNNINLNYNKIRSTNRHAVMYDDNTGYFFPLHCVPEIIDVFALYPELKEAEEKMTWLTRKWSEEFDVENSRKIIVETIYHLNRYIYYDNKESLKWICKNVPEMVQSFFIDFRKENEPVINKFILDKVRTREIAIEALFAEKNKDGSIYIRDGLLEYLTQNNSSQAKINRTIIHQALLGYLGKDEYHDKRERFPDVLFNTFTDNERREIVAHILNMVLFSYDLAVKDMYMQEVTELDEGLLQFYTDNDYFGLEYLKRGVAVYRMRFNSNH